MASEEVPSRSPTEPNMSSLVDGSKAPSAHVKTLASDKTLLQSAPEVPPTPSTEQLVSKPASSERPAAVAAPSALTPPAPPSRAAVPPTPSLTQLSAAAAVFALAVLLLCQSLPEAESVLAGWVGGGEDPRIDLHPRLVLLLPSARMLAAQALALTLAGVVSLLIGISAAASAASSPRSRGAWSLAAASLTLPLLLLPYTLPLHPLAAASLALYVWVAAWKLLDVLGGTNPPAVLQTPLRLFAHFVVPIEYRIGAEGRPERPDAAEWRRHLRSIVGSVVSFSCMLTVRDLANCYAGVYPQLCGACRIYVDVWLLYLFLHLSTGASALALSLLGFKPMTTMRAPLTEATSPSDFWGRRWNLLVHGLFRRTVFEPLTKRRGWPPTIAAAIAFACSGAFHEYAFLCPPAARASAGSVMLFFALQAPMVTAEKLVLLPLRARIGLMRCLPSPVLTVLLTSVMLFPFAPLFMAPLYAGGHMEGFDRIIPSVRILL